MLFASLTFFTRGVNAVPGANALTVIPNSPASLANNLVIPSKPALAAPYGMYDGACGFGARPAPDEILIIRPNLFFFIMGKTARVQ